MQSDNEVSSQLLQMLSRMERKNCDASHGSILDFVEIACQLASIVRFFSVLLLTGVVNERLVPQAEHVGKGGDSLGERKESSGDKSQNQTEQREIAEDE